MEDDMWLAVRLVRERQERTISALESAAIPYGLSGSNATAVWIATIDDAAVRQVRNVEILLRRTDFAAAAMRLGDVGFVEHHTATRILFLDGPTGKPSSATEIVFDDEPVVGKSPSYHSPGISSIVNIASSHIIALDSLVRFQLARYRLDDAVDLRDMLDVELIDESWAPRLPEDLAARLQHLIDTPDG